MDLFETKPFKIAMWMLTVCLIIYIAKDITFIFTPFIAVGKLLFFPVTFTVILYYLLAPFVEKLEERKIPKTVSIILIYMLIFIAGGLLLITLGALTFRQLLDLSNNFPSYIEHLKNAITNLGESRLFHILQANGFSISELGTHVVNSLPEALTNIGSSVSAAVNITGTIVITLILLPILLYFTLKDGSHLRAYILKYIPPKHKGEIKNMLREIDRSLSAYIQGQIIVSLSVGLLTYVGFLVIGLRHALLFSVIAVLANFIPYLGVIISTIPAVVIGFAISGVMGIKVLLVIIIVQQIEGFFITPHVMSNKLELHPLLVIIVLMMTGNLAGFFGLIIAIPLFIIFKIIIKHATIYLS